MRTLLYVGLHDGKLYSSPSGNSYVFPRFVARQQRTFALRFLNFVSGRLVEEELHIRSLKASLGWISLPPKAGRFKIQVGSGPSTSENTTAFIEWDASQEGLRSLLDGVTDRPSNFRVIKRGESNWMVGLEDGEPVTLSVVSNRLEPFSAANVEGVQIDGDWWYEVKLMQTPLAFTDSAELVLPPPPTIETIVDGYTDPSGTYFVNEIQRFYLPPDFQSLFAFRYNAERTSLLSREDGPNQYKAALDAILARENGSVAVRVPKSGVADIEFLGELGGVDVPQLEIYVPPESTPPGDCTFTLDLGRWALLAALRSETEITVPFEVRAVVVESAEDILDLDVSGKEVVLFNLPVTIARPLMWPSLAASQDIPWMRGPAPRNYNPSVPNQIITGQQQAYPTVIGDGEATEFVIDHNLSSEVAYIVVRENSAGGRILRDDEYTVVVESDDSVTISFPDPPAQDAYFVTIAAIGPASVFQAHEHTPHQVVSGGGYPALIDFMEEVLGRVGNLESVLPVTGPGETSSGSAGMVIELPAVAEVLFYRGEESLTGNDGLDREKLASLPLRAPAMLPAVHDASVSEDDWGTEPDYETAEGEVLKSIASETIDLSGFNRIPPSKLSVGGFAASDGRGWYPVSQYDDTNSYYPSAFERELWRVAINDQMLRIGRTLDLRFSVSFQLIHALSNALWSIVIETGVFTSADSPDPVGPNLQSVDWSAGTTILSQAVHLASVRQTHTFGARIKRDVSGLTTDQMLYGVWMSSEGNEPATANFALRARLVRWDTEDNVSNATGWVAFEMLPPLNSDGQPSGKAQIIIS